MATNPSNSSAIRLSGATLTLGGRRLWGGLDLQVEPGEFVAVLGPNGTGKTSLLKVLLGLVPLTKGRVEVAGEMPVRSRGLCGYVPQQRSFDADLPVRGRDIVRFGLDGGRFGWRRSAREDELVNRALAEVGAEHFADGPMGRLSGGEQQRLRIAQALVGDPQVLLCDEPLLSLDLSHQQAVTALIDRRRREANTAVLFVTHEINPILASVDRVLYLVNGRWAIGTPKEVLTTERLTELYGAPVDVVNVRGRLVVVAGSETGGHHD
ncbi:MAG TPA: metal ABC transporter ATP-binding protein [Candidatus Saccharimonadia bacterium]|nr:metal ABC transporter ATP-binding protein [Candidatus Saccharimonadia bacterium]